MQGWAWSFACCQGRIKRGCAARPHYFGPRKRQKKWRRIPRFGSGDLPGDSECWTFSSGQRELWQLVESQVQSPRLVRRIERVRIRIAVEKPNDHAQIAKLVVGLQCRSEKPEFVCLIAKSDKILSNAPDSFSRAAGVFELRDSPNMPIDRRYLAAARISHGIRKPKPNFPMRGAFRCAATRG